eukprot:COSAG02_NODE_67003_length_254_cov_0.651613_1_plen_74_part_01
MAEWFADVRPRRADTRPVRVCAVVCRQGEHSCVFGCLARFSFRLSAFLFDFIHCIPSVGRLNPFEGQGWELVVA